MAFDDEAVAGLGPHVSPFAGLHFAAIEGYPPGTNGPSEHDFLEDGGLVSGVELEKANRGALRSRQTKMI